VPALRARTRLHSLLISNLGNESTFHVDQVVALEELVVRVLGNELDLARLRALR
jgi:hypothetical protein